MRNEFGELDATEREMIRKHRAEIERIKQNDAFRLKALTVAVRYEKWLQETGRVHSFETFIHEFDYQEPDIPGIHELVDKILKAVAPDPGSPPL